MVLYVTNPLTGRKIEYKFNLKGTKTTYQKLEESGILHLADVVVENIKLPYIIRPGLVLTELLARSNSPIYLTNFPDKVVKLGNRIFNNLSLEYTFGSKFLNENIAVKFHEYGELPDLPFNYIVMERLDYSLESRRGLLTSSEFRKLVSDVCFIYSQLVRLKLAYNDFKPPNVMFSVKRNRWLLVDLESITDYGMQKAPHHTLTYSPTSFLLPSNSIKEVMVNSYTELENIAYGLYDVISTLPWKAITTIEAMKEYREFYPFGEMQPQTKEELFVLWLYDGSQNQQPNEVDFNAIMSIYDQIV